MYIIRNLSRLVNSFPAAPDKMACKRRVQVIYWSNYRIKEWVCLLRYILCAVLGYLLGSFSASILISKYIFRRDVRKSGSGNAGAANTARVFGIGAGLLTLGGDFLKCLIAMLLTRALAGEIGMCVGGMACMLGHCFPLYFRFRGGKAVATGAAVALLIDWRVLAIALAVYLLAAVLFRFASLASLCAAAAIPVSSLILSVSMPRLVLAIFTFVLVTVMHRGNIARLLAGTEPKFSFGTRPTK